MLRYKFQISRRYQSHWQGGIKKWKFWSNYWTNRFKCLCFYPLLSSISIRTLLSPLTTPPRSNPTPSLWPICDKIIHLLVLEICRSVKIWTIKFYSKPFHSLIFLFFSRSNHLPNYGSSGHLTGNTSDFLNFFPTFNIYPMECWFKACYHIVEFYLTNN